MSRPMREVSLIVSTLGERKGDLRALLVSLISQAMYIREVIVVDQHSDPEHLAALLADFQELLPIRHARSERGLSRARNVGLSLALGSLIAFPDDDCVYPEGLLQWVVKWFEANTKYDILAVGSDDASGVRSGNRWPQDVCDLRSVNAFRTTFSPSLFLRSGVATTHKFDVRLGVGSGTRYGSGEETDYILRMMHMGTRGRFDRTRNIIHPRRDMLSGGGSGLRAEAYGFGMGHLLRSHAFSVLWVVFLAYDLFRAGVAIVRGQHTGSGLCMAHAKGLWHGYYAPAEPTT
jgi:glycosyltransferase involved in cell wall biosynthesis